MPQAIWHSQSSKQHADRTNRLSLLSRKVRLPSTLTLGPGETVANVSQSADGNPSEEEIRQRRRVSKDLLCDVAKGSNNMQ